MGISGVGKSTIGQQLALLLNIPFLDADRFHTLANVDKMRIGIGLNDNDRIPWLEAIARELRELPGYVLACSALKQKYRSILASPDTWFVYLHAPESIVLDRINARKNHYAGPNLIKSQLADLEDPSNEPRVLSVDASARVDIAALALLLNR